jgi:hypothetical protein
MGLFDKIAYALAKKFTKDTIEGAGAVAGKNCIITNIQDIPGGHRITFQWTLDNGTVQTDYMTVMDGVKGDKGDTGAKGAQGVKGDKGDIGAKGDTGAAGAAATIEVGTVSSGTAPNVTNSGTNQAAVFNFVLPKGDKGDTGAKGEDGQDGKSFEIKAQYATYADLIAAHPTGEAGDAYFVGEGTSPDLYTWLSIDQEWYNNGPIAGVKGDKGDKGDDGFSPTATVSKTGNTVTIEITDKNGTTRKTVSDGSDGAPGADGDDGVGISSIDKTATAGLVDTYTITYSDGSTTTFNVTNGEDGAPGTNGEDGQDGQDGRGIVSVQKTATVGLVDTYTITFTDTTTETFTVTNGSGVPTGGTTGQILVKGTGANYDTKWDDIENLIPKNAGARNLYYRGKSLGSTFTAEQQAAIAAGTFEGLMLGDYWTVSGITYRIAGFDYWLHTGNTECTTHHVVIVPDQNMLAADGSTTHYMDSINDTTKGYAGTGFFTGKNRDNSNNTARATCRSMAQNAFGSGHILTHKELFTKTSANGKPTAGDWYDSDIDLMNEPMVYGSYIFAPANDGTTIPYLYTIDKSQLPLFAARPDLITNRAGWWLRDVVSSTHFAYVDYHGACSNNSASYASIGVRPAFAIC